MHEAVEEGVGLVGAQVAGDEHRHHQPIHGDDAAHDHGDEAAHDQLGPEHAHRGNPNAALGRADGGPDAGEGHGGEDACEAEEGAEGWCERRHLCPL